MNKVKYKINLKGFFHFCFGFEIWVYCFMFLLSFSVLSATKDYNISTESSFSGGTSFCLDQTVTNLSVTYNTCNYSTGAATAGTVTVTWYSNATNSTSGGTQVSQTTGASTGTSATVTFTYAPNITIVGTLYYYVIISAPNHTGCGVTTTLTTASTQTVTVAECFKTCVGGGGNWGTAATWVENALPQSYDRVTIVDGATVTINAAASAYNITVGQGTSGILQFETTTARTLTVSNNVTIASGGTFQSATTGTQTSHVLSIAGNLTNNGVLDFSTNSNTAAAGITFTGTSNTTFSGTGGTTDLKTLTINKGTSTTPVLELSPSNFTIQGVTTDVAGFLTLTNGTFKISGSFTMTNRVFTSAGYTIGSTTGLNLNNTNFTVAAQTSSAYINAGILTINAGTYNSGTAIDNGFFYYAGSTITINGGSMNIAGNLYPMASGTITYTQTGGTLTVCTVGNTAAQPAFYTTTGSTFNMSAGSIVNRLVNTGASKYDFDNSAATRTITGGTLQLGDASSGTAKIYVITGYLPNLLVTNTSGNHTAKWYNFGAANNVLLTTTLQNGTTLDANTNSSAVTYTGDITMGTSSTFLGGTNTQNVSSNWINNGTLTPSTGTINFNGGSAQTISGSSTTSFYNLTIANTSGGVSLAVNSTVTNTLTLTSGKLTVQGYTLTIGTGSANGSISGGSSSTYIVAYDNSGTIGYLKRFINSNATYAYPVGDASNYTPLTFVLSASTLASAYLTVYTKATKVTGLNAAVTSYINRYWDVSPSGISSPTYDISYTYVDGDIVGTETGLLPIKKSGTTWYKPTGSSFTDGTAQGTGSLTAGTNLLSWTGLSTFSLFGGGVNAVVALPIELVSFTGQKSGQNNELKWTTASELNNDNFTVEKTLDGTNFEVVGIENGAGNSNQYLDYTLIDYDVRNVLNYYRLKQTDFDGKYNFSEIIVIDNRTNTASKEVSIITNILGQEVNEYYRGIVIIVYSDGTSVKVIQ